MCGIVGVVAERNVSGILVEGLQRLEYRGYDSAGVAMINTGNQLQASRHAGKVAVLESELQQSPIKGTTGIAHTRWATHGIPSDTNAHPHLSGHIAVVHNGIIENYRPLRETLSARGYVFVSDTDTEVVAHLMHLHYQQSNNLLTALNASIEQLEGAYALAIISENAPDQLVATRRGSPLVLGKGVDEMYVASDTLALRQVTDRFIYLDEGDVVHLHTAGRCDLYNGEGEWQVLNFTKVSGDASQTDKGNYRHFMAKEIHEQPSVVANTFQPFLGKSQLLIEAFGVQSSTLFEKTKAIQLVACGSSYFASMVAKQWFESWLNIPCQVEIASEFLYRDNHVMDDCLFVTISQSGETADTMSALRKAQQQSYIGSFAICNVANSSLVREVDAYMLTQAGFEISVASTKAFVAQLTALQLLVIGLGRYRGLSLESEQELVSALKTLPNAIEQVLAMEESIAKLAKRFIHDNNMLFLGRGQQFAIANEGALKMKEISYIHAEAYASGELKHGPLALVDEHMPVIAIAPNDALLDKLRSNLREVEARGGKLYVIADSEAEGLDDIEGIRLPHVHTSTMPMLYTVPLQLLAYHVAVIKGNDVDQPRNLAKSVTVE